MSGARARRNRLAVAANALNDARGLPSSGHVGECENSGRCQARLARCLPRQQRDLPPAIRRRVGATGRKKTLEFLLFGALKALRSGRGD
jgi:hypothetical protein